MTLSLHESLSVVEFLIYGFIGVNMFLSGTYLMLRAFKKLAGSRAS